jgi:large subunit ribosomal protein L3
MKVGMLSIYDGHGVRYPVTILQLDSCQVVQVKTEETNGYTAMQLGVGEAKAKRVKLPQQGHFEKADVAPKRKLMEFRVSPDCILPVGTTIRAQHFVPGQVQPE